MTLSLSVKAGMKAGLFFCSPISTSDRFTWHLRHKISQIEHAIEVISIALMNAMGIERMCITSL
ncbi:hypothetical protein TSA66_20720 [Noviherbaspirillum autotrophicum]|uniref:Uncharacterized protein n=1 Tax=Noviherbaspirillum autotrophicum TaxID=709839 RepID=A0A0C1YQ07_9BURK|nr:hypothetical protein TSA66_20720 [Noviherbaspirillum autotrophicum]